MLSVASLVFTLATAFDAIIPRAAKLASWLGGLSGIEVAPLGAFPVEPVPGK